MMSLSEEAKPIFLSTLRRIEIGSVIEERVRVHGDTLSVDGRELDLSSFSEIILVGIGKASIAMGAAFERLLGDRISKSLLVADRHHNPATRAEVILSGHPIPNERSFTAGRRITDLAKNARDTTLMIFLISGGGSAMAESPISDEISLEDVRNLNRFLVHCGANIREINVIRKHVSSIKGGRLGYLCRQATLLSFYTSDVNSGDIRSIASNPILEDDSTIEEFYSILERFDMMNELPRSIASLIECGGISPLPVGWASPDQSLSRLLLDNSDAIKTAGEEAEKRGFLVALDYTTVEGEYTEMARSLLARLCRLQESHPYSPVCLISGGEASCSVRGKGTGGRNQEFVLYSAAQLAGLKDDFTRAVLSCGTDGIDGNSNAAGGVVDESTERLAEIMGLKISPYIQNNDSNTFLKQVGGLVFTGPTGNNVRDLRIMLSKRREIS